MQEACGIPVVADVGRDRIDISGIAGKWNLGAATTRQIGHAFHQIVGALRTFVVDHRFERVEPLLGFHHIGIVGGLDQNLVELS